MEFFLSAAADGSSHHALPVWQRHTGGSLPLCPASTRTCQTLFASSGSARRAARPTSFVARLVLARARAALPALPALPYLKVSNAPRLPAGRVRGHRIASRPRAEHEGPSKAPSEAPRRDFGSDIASNASFASADWGAAGTARRYQALIRAEPAQERRAEPFRVTGGVVDRG